MAYPLVTGGWGINAWRTTYGGCGQHCMAHPLVTVDGGISGCRTVTVYKKLIVKYIYVGLGSPMEAELVLLCCGRCTTMYNINEGLITVGNERCVEHTSCKCLVRAIRIIDLFAVARFNVCSNSS